MDPVSAFLLSAITYGGPKVLDAVIGLAVAEGWDVGKGTLARWRERRGRPTGDAADEASPELVEAARSRISSHAATARTVTDVILAPPTAGGSPQDILEALRIFLAGVFAGVGDSGLAALGGSLSSGHAVSVVDIRSARTLNMPPTINDAKLWFPPIQQSLEMAIPRMWVTGTVTPSERDRIVSTLRDRFGQRDLLGREQSPAPIFLNAASIAAYSGLSDPRRVAKIGEISHRELVIGPEGKAENVSLGHETALALLDDMRAEEQLRLDHAKAGLSWDSLSLKPEGIRALGVAVRDLVADRQLRFDAESAHSHAVAAALSGLFTI